LSSGSIRDEILFSCVVSHQAGGGDVTTVLARNSGALSAADRCDRCGAQAYVRVSLVTGGELLFCAHHAKQHRAALEGSGAAFHDETERLDDVSAVAALDER
jgi:hypothetical protein